jgi:hypothetical protein
MSRSIWRWGAWVSGIALVWVGTAADVTPLIVLGIVAVVVSMFAWPWGAAAYRTKVVKISNQCTVRVGDEIRTLLAREQEDRGLRGRRARGS